MSVPAIPFVAVSRWSVVSGVVLSGLVGACAVGAQGAPPAYLDPSTADSTTPTPVSSRTGTNGPQAVPWLPAAQAAPVRPSPLLAEMVIHVHPAAGTVSVTRVDPGPGAAPVELSVQSLLKSAACPVGFQTATICFDVSLLQSFPRSLSHVFLQVVSVTDPMTGLELYSHGGINGDPSEQALDAAKGLWQLTGVDSAVPGVIGQSPFGTAQRQLVFANDDGADVDFRVELRASLAYGSYLLDFSSQPFIDACEVGAELSANPTAATFALPFPFTLYGSTSSVVQVGLAGIIALGEAHPVMSGKNVDLPNAAAPGPAIFPFWDDIGYRASGSAVCAVTLGSAPNRQVVLTWKDLDFHEPNDSGAHLSFSTVLSEGSNSIDFVYDTMSGPTSRASGASATVGVQDTAGFAATAEFQLTDFGTGDAYTIVPVP